MKVHVQHLNIRSTDVMNSWAEQQILALGAERQIDEANIRLTRLQDASPAYEVRVHLVTPGPDVFAESRDHTLRAAFAKVMEQIHFQITNRATKRLRRLKSNLKARQSG